MVIFSTRTHIKTPRCAPRIYATFICQKSETNEENMKLTPAQRDCHHVAEPRGTAGLRCELPGVARPRQRQLLGSTRTHEPWHLCGEPSGALLCATRKRGGVSGRRPLVCARSWAAQPRPGTGSRRCLSLHSGLLRTVLRALGSARPALFADQQAGPQA